MKCKTLKVGNSLYLHIPESIVKEKNVEEKKEYYPSEELLKKLFEE